MERDPCPSDYWWTGNGPEEISFVDWLNLGLRRAVLALRRASMYPNQAEIIKKMQMDVYKIKGNLSTCNDKYKKL